jgi:tetratricopeptide (TPR) repeat protein
MAALREIWENNGWPIMALKEVTLTPAPEVQMREATQLHRENRVPEAIAAYQSIVARWPKLADAWFNLAILQRQTHNLGAALNSYQKALEAGVANPEEVHLNRSVIFSDYLRDSSSAARELQQALTLNPGFSPALLNLANLYEDFGKRSEASALYARILSIDPKNFEALARFANMQRTELLDPALIERLRSALLSATAPADRASLGFAIGRLLDGVGRYSDAFAAYQAANEASLSSAGSHVVPYEAARQEAFVNELMARGTPTARATPNSNRPRPVFIVGMFRSGSTLVEQLLASIPGVAAGGELDFVPRFVHTELVPYFDSLAALTHERLDSVAARYRADLQRVSAQADFVTDKRPDNFLNIGLIKALFPDAKIVHTVRDPLDNCLSIFFLHLEQQMSYGLKLMDIGHYFREYRRLMAHWKAEFADDIFDFDYDALVQSPESAMGALCRFLGLPWSGQLPNLGLHSGAVKTASVWQIREPLYKHASGRSRNYANELQALSEYLSRPT